jgi:DNA polymerase-3 subunit alpha
MAFENSFIHLHTHSAYSLAEGAIPVKKLVGLCKDLNMPAVAITDTNNMFGGLEFAIEASKAGIQSILGSQILLGLEKHQLVLLCQNEVGYKNLCKILTDAYLDADVTDKPNIDWDTLQKHNDGLICLTGGLKGPVSQYLLHNQNKQAEQCLKKLKDIFKDRLYIELQRHNLSEETIVENPLIDLAYKYEVPLVATNDCYFTSRDMHEAHDALLCIANGRYIIEEDRRKETSEHYFKSAKEMRELFSDIPEALDNTLIIAQRCHFLLKPIDPILPVFETEEGRTEVQEMEYQATEGLKARLNSLVITENTSDHERKELEKKYFDRLKFELNVINEMGFPGYFLIVSDFIKWAKEQNIPVGPGRGSGAGSVVAWAMQITDIDPLPFNLLFERFLNPERVSMPDFDIDFCQDRRDEVIRYVQEKYGYDRVAQIITFGKLQARAVVRDVGRVLQMPYGQVDRIAKLIPNNPANPTTLEEALEQDEELRNECRKDETADKLISIALKLEGLFRHASTHAAGVVIGDRPLHELVPLYRDPRSDMPVTQFNMKYVEKAGLVKFDFLGLKNMTVIQKAIEIIESQHGKKIDILQVPLNDKKTYEMLARGENTGVFQMESAGMRDLGKKMKICTFEHIIAVVALYRPGPMENIPKYLACLSGQEEIDYMHPKLEGILKDTYGIMIYQEQVMQAAQILAGYTLGGADLLRRAMGKKIKEEMDAQRELFVKGAKEHNDVSAEKANQIFDQIAKFAGYGFNKAHSAGYALIAYWTAWLKANYTVEFMAASMTLDMGNPDKLSIFKQELDRIGIKLLPPDINKSDVIFTVEDNSIRYALAALKGVGEAAMESLIEVRNAKGEFKDIGDFITKIDPSIINKRQIEKMISAGVFDSLENNRASLLLSSDMLLRHANTLKIERESGQSNLFGAEENNAQIPELETVEPWEILEKLKYEFDAVGFYLSAHPLDDKLERFKTMGITSFSDIENILRTNSSAMTEMAGVLMKKQIRVSPKTGNKYAFLQFSDATGVYEVLVFSELLARCQDNLEIGETLLIKVLLEEKDEQIRFTAQNIKKLEESLTDKLEEVHIDVTNPEVIQILRELLDQSGKGRAKVIIHVPLWENKDTSLLIPGGWSFTSQVKNELVKLDGVLQIREK